MAGLAQIQRPLTPDERAFCEQRLVEGTLDWFFSDQDRLRAFLAWMMDNPDWAEAFCRYREKFQWWRELAADDERRQTNDR